MPVGCIHAAREMMNRSRQQRGSTPEEGDECPRVDLPVFADNRQKEAESEDCNGFGKP
jgi:hypothetical protein